MPKLYTCTRQLGLGDLDFASCILGGFTINTCVILVNDLFGVVGSRKAACQCLSVC